MLYHKEKRFDVAIVSEHSSWFKYRQNLIWKVRDPYTIGCSTTTQQKLTVFCSETEEAAAVALAGSSRPIAIMQWETNGSWSHN